jgi:hypothetical protein
MHEESNGRSPRFSLWVGFLVFSTITLGSIVEVVKDPDYNTQSKSAEKWSVFCSALTFTLTLIVVIAHLNATASVLFVGQKAEGILSLVLAGFWVATVAVVTDSRHGLAVDEYGAVQNGNLYYFSWAGFVCSIILLVSYLRHVFGVDVAGEIRTRSVRLTTWSALLSTSLVVMGASANYYDTMCGGGGNQSVCSRSVFGIILGAISTLSSVGIVGLKIATSKAPFLLETGVSFLLVILYGFGVAFITAPNGPGSPLGNIYYFTWGSFLAAFSVLASCFEDYNAASSAQMHEVNTTEENEEA